MSNNVSARAGRVAYSTLVLGPFFVFFLYIHIYNRPRRAAPAACCGGGAAWPILFYKTSGDLWAHNLPLYPKGSIFFAQPLEFHYPLEAPERGGGIGGQVAEIAHIYINIYIYI